MGGVPTSPRIPSVPKYFRIWVVNSTVMSSIPRGVGHGRFLENCSTPTAAPDDPKKWTEPRERDAVGR